MDKDIQSVAMARLELAESMLNATRKGLEQGDLPLTLSSANQAIYDLQRLTGFLKGI